MNTMNPEQLDDRIRTMMRTAVERTDVPPTIDDVVAGLSGVTVGRDAVDGSPRRWVAIAAALLLVIAGASGGGCSILVALP